MSNIHCKDVITIARAAGYGGLLPFIAALLVLLFSADPRWAAASNSVLIGYAAVILSFVGAVHWGIVLKSDLSKTPPVILVVSIIPALLGWLSLFLPAPFALGLLVACFMSLYSYEKKYLWATEFPDWYQTLRTHLTFVVSGILLIAWIMSLG